MKRTLAILLALSLSLCAASAFAADAVNISLYLNNNQSDTEEEKYVIGGAALGDSVYIITNATLESWKPGDAAPTVVLDAISNPDSVGDEQAAQDEKNGKLSISRLFTTADALYGLSTRNGKVWKLADKSGPLAQPEAAQPLDWQKILRTSPDSDTSYAPQLGDIAVVGDTLFATATDWNQTEQTYELLSWSLTTGSLLEDRTDLPLRSISAYRDGLLIGKLFDDMHSWDEATQTQKMPDLVTLDPATGKTETLLTFTTSNITGVRYWAATDTLYYVQNSTVYSMPAMAQPAKISAYLPNSIWDETSVSLLGGNMISVADSNGMIVRGLDMPGIENGALTIYGEYSSSGHQAYLAAYPQALVTVSDAYYSSLEEFTNAMVASTNTVDVLRLNTDYTPLTRLIDKGYALDLSAYPELKDAVGKMDPRLTGVCMKDGKLYGVPVELYASSFGYNEKAWEELGLTKDDLPTSIMGVLDFMANWQADYGEDHPDLMITDNGSVKYATMDWLLSSYIAYQNAQGQDISLDTDLFRKLIAKMESIDFTELDADTESEDSDYWSREAVFSNYVNATYPGQYRYDMKLLNLPLDDGLDPALPASLQVFIINPRTTHLEQAVQYLSTYVQNLERDSNQITLYPDQNEPVINQTFDRDLANWKEAAAEYQKMLETAKPEEKADLQDSLDYLNDRIQNADTYRFTVSADEIAFYRQQIAPWLVITGQSPLENWSKDGTNEFATLEQQYVQGAIPSDQYIREFDKRIRMMQLEDK